MRYMPSVTNEARDIHLHRAGYLLMFEIAAEPIAPFMWTSRLPWDALLNSQHRVRSRTPHPRNIRDLRRAKPTSHKAQ
jgi:hypothetical protein